MTDILVDELSQDLVLVVHGGFLLIEIDAFQIATGTDLVFLSFSVEAAAISALACVNIGSI